MAHQESIIKLKGKIGDLTFYKTKNGYLARRKGGVSATRIASDPNYQRTRENMAEFGRAGKAAKLFRTVFRNLILQASDNTMSNRLTSELLKVIQADATNERGARMVIDAETELLTGFEFNVKGRMNGTVFVPYAHSIDRISGLLTVSFPAFSSKDFIANPPGATHFKFKAAGAMINFENEIYEIDVQETAVENVNITNLAAINLNCQLSANSSNPIFLLLGIEFYQQVNGQNYLLSNGIFNGLSVINVNGI